MTEGCVSGPRAVLQGNFYVNNFYVNNFYVNNFYVNNFYVTIPT